MPCPRLGEEKLLPRKPEKRAARGEWLRLLYLENRFTAPELGRLFGVNHKSVYGALKRFGIPTRRSGPVEGVECCEAECHLPIYRVRHKTNGSMYGRRCRLHWIIFRMNVNNRYNDKHLGKDDEAWLRRLRQLLAQVQRLNREVSQSLNTASAPATTSLGVCPPL